MGVVPAKTPIAPYPTSDQTSRIVLVTGASGGLGAEACRHYVRLGASKVILTARSVGRGESVKKDIERSTGRQGVMEVWPLDYDSFESIRVFASRVKAELPRLDIVILNAGVTKPRFELSPEGWEETIQVNVLSTVLLAMLLLPFLQARSTDDYIPRLVVVGSSTHEGIKKFPVQDSSNVIKALNTAESFGPLQARYSLSKLLVTYATREIAKLALSTDGQPRVIVTHNCPGAVATDLGRDYDTLFFRAFKWYVAKFVQKTAEEGSRTYLATADCGAEANGQYYRYDKIDRVGPLVEGETGQRLQSRVWNDILEILKPQSPEVERIAQRLATKTVN